MGDVGWITGQSISSENQDDSDVQSEIQISSEIIKSFYIIGLNFNWVLLLILDKMVNKRRPALKHRRFRTVRDYMTYLLKEFPTLTPTLIENYNALYEKARYGSKKYTLDDWNDVKSKILAVQSVIELS